MQEGAIAEDDFVVPEFCPDKPDDDPAARLRARRMGGLARMRALLPNAHYGAPCTVPQCVHHAPLASWGAVWRVSGGSPTCLHGI